MLTSFLRFLLALVALTVGMSVVQWLAAPSGGANNMSDVATDLGHPTIGQALARINSSPVLRRIDDAWQRGINAPRNRLLYDLGYMYDPDFLHFYGASHTTWVGDVWNAFIFCIGTVVVYLPLVAGLALVRASGWAAMRRPVLIALVVYLSAVIAFGLTSNADGSRKAAMILGSLSLLALAVAVRWTPLLTRRRRVIAFAVLLVVLSAIGMLSITRGRGPDDALSYPIFFGWTAAVLMIEGGAFLLVVGALLRVIGRRGTQRSTAT